MDLQKIAKQLKRDAIRSPKKAGILGILAIVACYYWVPLVGGWFTDAKSAETMAMVPESNEKPIAFGSRPTQRPPESVETAPQTPSHTWREVVLKIEQDPFTRAVPPTDLWRDPFHLSLRPVEEPEEPSDPKPKAAEPTRWTPQDFAMELVGTAKSSETGMAMIQADGLIAGSQKISRSMYSEGDNIHLAKEDRQVVFVLSEVHSRHVVLRHENNTFALAMPERTFAGAIRGSTRSK